ncbi:class I SAM-dependent methyltransferase [Thiohalocapsa halophila]|nr:class I SAM-dependent methyltransferase [Thiohalocapsa halophila]
MGARERRLLLDLLAPAPTTSVLDVGCGTGYFSSVLADAGLRVTGLDPDAAALNFALRRDPRITGVRGDAEALPFADTAFNAAVAMTSLCFCGRPEQALSELWRVSREAVVLGLLHRRSLLYWQKAGRGSYQGARWDQLSEVRAWAQSLDPRPVQIEARSALLLPSAGPLARWAERLSGIGQHSERLPLGGFLAVCLRRPAGEWHSLGAGAGAGAGAGQARTPGLRAGPLSAPIDTDRSGPSDGWGRADSHFESLT